MKARMKLLHKMQTMRFVLSVLSHFFPKLSSNRDRKENPRDKPVKQVRKAILGTENKGEYLSLIPIIRIVNIVINNILNNIFPVNTMMNAIWTFLDIPQYKGLPPKSNSVKQWGQGWAIRAANGEVQALKSVD